MTLQLWRFARPKLPVGITSQENSDVMIHLRIQKEKILRDPCRRQRLRKVSTNVPTNVPSNVLTKVLTTVNWIISREYSKWGVQEEGVDQPEYSRPRLLRHVSYATSLTPRTPSTSHAITNAINVTCQHPRINATSVLSTRNTKSGECREEVSTSPGIPGDFATLLS